MVEYYPKHTGPINHKITNIKSSWLAKKYLSTFIIDPRKKSQTIADEFKMETNLTVSRQQVARARKIVLEYLYGTEEE